MDLSAPFPLNCNHAPLLCNFLYFCEIMLQGNQILGGTVIVGYWANIGSPADLNPAAKPEYC